MTSQPLTVYKASAGSGKTFTLAVQYIKLLVTATEPGEYAHVLGVTFTNKATAEMKDRIIVQLYNIANGQSDDYFAALRKAIDDEAKATGNPALRLTDDDIRTRCADALYDILHDYSRFRVQTIDSFFQIILRGLAHELGLMANPQVEISDTEVLTRAIDQIVERLDDEPVVQECLMDMVNQRMEDNKRWDVRGDIKRFGHAIFNEQFLRLGDELRELMADKNRVRTIHAMLVHQRDEAIAGLRETGDIMDEAMRQSGYDYKQFSNGSDIETLVRKLRLASAKDEIVIGSRLQAKLNDDDPQVMLRQADRKPMSPLLDIADTMHSLLRQAANLIKTATWTINSAAISLQHLKELQLLDYIDSEVRTINNETSRFNLSKTPILLARMIKDTDAPFIFEKIGARLHHVMIDEFQDTSRLQWDNFKSLLLESYSRGGRNLVVGDVKQSIYRFRGGDWRTLGYIEDEVKPTPTIVPLDTNYRSERRVVEFNNAFFLAAVPKLDAIHAEREKQLGMEGLFAHAYADVKQQLKPDKPKTGFVKVTLVDKPKKDNSSTPKDDTTEEALDIDQIVVDDVKHTIASLTEQGVRPSDITILVRNRKDGQPILDAMVADPTMPRVVSSEAFLLEASPAIALLIDILRVLDDRVKNNVAHYHMQQVGIDMEAFDNQYDELQQMPLYQLVETLYKWLPKDVAEGQDAYMFALLDAVIDYVQRNAGDTHTFIRFWDDKLHSQPIPANEPDGIRIMTIHQAKGLEFHTVLIPACEWKMEKFKTDTLIWCKPEGEPFQQLKLMPVNGTSKQAANSAYQKTFVEEHLMANLDELNALYVALTRARSNLFIWSTCKLADAAKMQTTAQIMAAVLPAMGMETREIQVEQANDDDPVCITTYTSGDIVASTTKEEADGGRMNARPEPLDVKMFSNGLGVQFRQSNNSKQYLQSLDDAYDTDDELLLAEQSRLLQYIETGHLLHNVLQHIRTAADIPSVLDRMEHEGTISRHGADGVTVTVKRSHIEKWLQRGLDNPQVADWFSPCWTLFNECAIVSLDDNDVPMHRRPDRVMVSADERQVVVVDFKFGKMHSDYEEQVQDYMQLLQGIYPQASVSGYLWFVYSNKVQPIEPKP